MNSHFNIRVTMIVQAPGPAWKIHLVQERWCQIEFDIWVFVFLEMVYHKIGHSLWFDLVLVDLIIPEDGAYLFVNDPFFSRET